MNAIEAPLVFDGAGKRFGEQWAVRDLTLGVAPGTIFGLIGPSGCGKTTAIRLANGVYRPDAGHVRLFGRPPSQLGAADRLDIGYLAQQPVLFQDLSLWENLNFHASLNGVRMRRRRRLHELLELVDLEGEQKKLVREASGGMQRRLALAAALVHRPAVLMLDEPTAGIDPILRRRFWGHFRSLSDSDRTIVITTQHVGEAADCDIVGLLTGGRLIALGPPESLRREAVGGDVVEIETMTPLDSELIDGLRRHELVRTMTTPELNRARMIVDDGGAALPALVRWLGEREVEIADSEEVTIPYDDVFVELVERAGDAYLDADLVEHDTARDPAGASR